MPASSLRLDEVGEDRLVERLTRGLPTNSGVVVGAGDDCAVVARDGDSWTLLKTDCVVEDVHFQSAGKPLAYMERVGWKALARNVSDIAAMGGVPEHALVTVALPRSYPVAKVEALYAGLGRCARQYGVAIVGGETARSPEGVFISVALTGHVEKQRCIRRSGGKPGDVIYVTGELGGSITGKHLDFTPRLEEARWLTEHFTLHSMMDLSDGLGSDLPRLARQSRCGFELRGPLPAAPGVSQEGALRDGEDFELLFTLAPEHAARLEKEWAERFASLRLTRIGQLVPLGNGASAARTSTHGFDHFAPSAGDV